MEGEDFEVVSLIIQGFLITVLCIFGIVGSLLSAIVLVHREMRSAVSSLLLGLTVSDIIFILGQFQMVGMYCIIHYLDPLSYYVTHFQPFSLPYWWYASSLAQTAGLCFAISITVERYIAICYPFYAKSYCSWRQANYLSIGILIFSSIYALPNLFAFQTILHDNETNTYSIAPTEFGESELFEEYYEFWGNMTVHVFIPFTILIILNVIIITKMRSARKTRAQMTRRLAVNQSNGAGALTFIPSAIATTSSASVSLSRSARKPQSPNRNTTNMLIAICVVFSLCYTPVTIYRIWERAVSPSEWTDPEQLEFYLEHRLSLFVLLTIGRVTVTTNSSLNFIIYCVMGRKFRSLLLRIFRVKVKKLKNRAFRPNRVARVQSLSGSNQSIAMTTVNRNGRNQCVMKLNDYVSNDDDDCENGRAPESRSEGGSLEGSTSGDIF